MKTIYESKNFVVCRYLGSDGEVILHIYRKSSNGKKITESEIMIMSDIEDSIGIFPGANSNGDSYVLEMIRPNFCVAMPEKRKKKISRTNIMTQPVKKKNRCV